MSEDRAFKDRARRDIERLRQMEEAQLKALVGLKRRLRIAEGEEEPDAVEDARRLVAEAETDLEACQAQLGDLTGTSIVVADLIDTAQRNAVTFSRLWGSLLGSLTSAMAHFAGLGHNAGNAMTTHMAKIRRVLDSLEVELPKFKAPSLEAIEAHIDGAVEIWGEIDTLLALDKRTWTKLTSLDPDILMKPLAHTEGLGTLRVPIERLAKIRAHVRNQEHARTRGGGYHRKRKLDPVTAARQDYWKERAASKRRDWSKDAREMAAAVGVTLPTAPARPAHVLHGGGSLNAAEVERRHAEQMRARRAEKKLETLTN